MRLHTQISGSAICRCNFEIKKIATSKSLITYPLHSYIRYKEQSYTACKLHRPRFAPFRSRNTCKFPDAIVRLPFKQRCASSINASSRIRGIAGQLGRKHVSTGWIRRSWNNIMRARSRYFCRASGVNYELDIDWNGGGEEEDPLITIFH